MDRGRIPYSKFRVGAFWMDERDSTGCTDLSLVGCNESIDDQWDCTLGRTDRPDRRLTAATLLIWVLGLGFSYLRINLAVMQPQFRFLQSVLPIVAAFAAGGLLMPWQSKSVQWVSVTGVALALVLMNGWIVTHVVMPFYAISF